MRLEFHCVVFCDIQMRRDSLWQKQIVMKYVSEIHIKQDYLCCYYLRTTRNKRFWNNIIRFKW